MGMPIITPGDNTVDQVITNLIESVAMQETSLSHILNAEGEKMESIITMDGTSTEELLEMNRLAGLMVNAVTRLELILQGKVELFANCSNVRSGSINCGGNGGMTNGSSIR